MAQGNFRLRLGLIAIAIALLAAACGDQDPMNMDDDMMAADDGDRMSSPIDILNDGTTALEGLSLIHI